MTYSHLISILAGAGITALIYQLFVLPGVSHGQPRPAAPPPAAAARAESPQALAEGVLRRLAAPGGAAEVRDKAQAIEALQAQIDKLRADGQESQRRIEATEGKPQSWPSGLPAGYRAEVLEANLQRFLGKTQLGSLADIDCDEFPCIAIIEAKEQDAGWGKRLEDALIDFGRGADLGKRFASSMWTHERQQGDRQIQLSAVALAPTDAFGDEARLRTGHRAQAALANLLRPPKR